ncbi:hypothetical protein H9W90_04020 [Polaribacter pectinis]|uniref:Uncharacterized protein n=1 Tax=Polaribacter pectinis TaxID=2738844 RepID=A0A7G9LCE8_9FLAO|nr:hypothetical protein [Polaribacter pectinis]QNM86297.1 hypothetical protein H9W90_04020 [Polaribacter pectinis]
MAHENLKFRLDLNERNDWQPILATQEFGTFFMVYIKFKDFIEENNQGLSIKSYKCDFKLQNFKGDITIGFSNNTPILTYPDGTRPYDNELNAYINIVIQPFNLNHEINDCNLIVTQPLEKGLILQTYYDRVNPPINISDPLHPEKSLYLNPNKLIRDGEFYSEISTRKLGDTNPFPNPNDAGCRNGLCVADRLIIV